MGYEFYFFSLPCICLFLQNTSYKITNRNSQLKHHKILPPSTTLYFLFWLLPTNNMYSWPSN